MTGLVPFWEKTSESSLALCMQKEEVTWAHGKMVAVYELREEASEFNISCYNLDLGLHSLKKYKKQISIA